MTQTPVTVLTGYLGAGKTTLLNRILSEDHGRRYAVIVNEFGEVGIDNDLILNTDEELFEMNNGCICCTVRGDLIKTMHGLLAKRGNFDAIVVETTGLADPGPVAQTFFVDSFLQERTALDSVTTVVDAKHILPRVTDKELHEIEGRLRKLNPLAPIHRAQRSNVALDKVLGRGGFDIDRIVSLEPDFLNPADGEAGHVHDEQCEHDHHEHEHQAHDHEHDAGISSISLTADRPMDGGKISDWLAYVVQTQGQDILRAKGIIDVKGEDRRLVFQAVHMLLEGDLQRPWKPDEQRYSRLVFIGRNLD